ncbi:MAG: alpha/beta fold hydrolase [Solirubrobacteraceae bacterium]|nr:alpha/beta fold hydrolase [Solirubrobacteraceae bacterium]
MTGIASHHREGAGTPVVLLHGFTGSWRIWRHVIPTLAAHHDVIAIALPGHAGWEDAVELERGVPGIVDALERRLDDLGVDRPHLVGNSLGGWLSIELARRGRARSLTALSPAGAWERTRDRARVIRLMHLTAAYAARTPPSRDRLLARPRMRRLALRSVAEHGDRVPYHEAVEIMADARACTAVEPFLRWAATVPSLLQVDDAPECPSVVAWSECDRVLPFARYGRPMVEALGPVAVRRLRGVGHVPMLDDPGLVAHTILSLTSRVDEPTGARIP